MFYLYKPIQLKKNISWLCLYLFPQWSMHISKTKRARNLWFVAFWSLYHSPTSQHPQAPLDVLKSPWGAYAPRWEKLVYPNGDYQYDNCCPGPNSHTSEVWDDNFVDIRILGTGICCLANEKFHLYPKKYNCGEGEARWR